jgi:hypothetical protein
MSDRDSPRSADITSRLSASRVRVWAAIREGQCRPGYVAVFAQFGVNYQTNYCHVGCVAGLAAKSAASRGASVSSMDAADIYGKLRASERLLAISVKAAVCRGNAAMKRMFLFLKMECAWQCDYANHVEAMRDVADYLVGFNNNIRLYSNLRYLPHNAYELLSAAKLPSAWPHFLDHHTISTLAL